MNAETRRAIGRWAATSTAFVAVLLIATVVTLLVDILVLDPTRFVETGPAFCGTSSYALRVTGPWSMAACLIASIGIAAYSSYRCNRWLRRRQAPQSTQT